MDEDLASVEARLRALLEPYAATLETATIYGLPTLRRPGAKAHDWFAFVKRASKHVSLFLLPVYAHPTLLDPLSPGLRARLTGKSTFTFRTIADDEAAELEDLLARAYAAYVAG